MTNEEAILKAKAHMLAQTMQALNEYTACVYWNDKGNTCGVGCLVPIELAQRMAEAKLGTWRRINALEVSEEVSEKQYEVARAAIAALEGVTPAVLDALQRIHDDLRVKHPDGSRSPGAKLDIAKECDTLLKQVKLQGLT